MKKIKIFLTLALSLNLALTIIPPTSIPQPRGEKIML